MIERCMGAVALAAGTVIALAPAANAAVNTWAIGNNAGDASKAQQLFGLTVAVDFNASAGSVILHSATPVIDQNNQPTTTNDLLNPTAFQTWNPGLGYVNGRIYASNQFNSATPNLLTGEIDPGTGLYRGINDQGATDTNPFPPPIGPVTSNNPRSNGLVASFAGNPPGQGEQNLVVGITQDAIQYGFNADNENPIGNIGPAPLGFDPVQDVEGLGTDAANDIAYVIDDRTNAPPVLLEANDPSGGGLNITETPLPFLDAPGLDNFGLTYSIDENAIIVSATSSDAFGLPLTEFYAINPADPTQAFSIGILTGVQIGGLAAIPAPGTLTVATIAGAAALRRRRP